LGYQDRALLTKNTMESMWFEISRFARNDGSIAVGGGFRRRSRLKPPLHWRISVISSEARNLKIPVTFYFIGFAP